MLITDPKESDILKLPNKEFKITIIFFLNHVFYLKVGLDFQSMDLKTHPLKVSVRIVRKCKLCGIKYENKRRENSLKEKYSNQFNKKNNRHIL